MGIILLLLVVVQLISYCDSLGGISCQIYNKYMQFCSGTLLRTRMRIYLTFKIIF